MRYWYNWTLFFSSVQSYLLRYVHDADCSASCSAVQMIIDAKFSKPSNVYRELEVRFYSLSGTYHDIILWTELETSTCILCSRTAGKQGNDLLANLAYVSFVVPMIDSLTRTFACRLMFVLQWLTKHSNASYFSSTCLSYGRQKCLSQTHTAWLLEASLWRISHQLVTVRRIAASARWLATNWFLCHMPGCSAYELWLMTTELSKLQLLV
jgi:hypothetical protein